MLRTRLCDLLGIEIPILNAPMGGGPANGELAAAISAAGGLGLIGGMAQGREWLRGQIRLVRERTDRPFGVGFISHWLPDFPGLYEVALEEGVPVIAHSFADPAPYMAQARAIGARVICQVRAVEQARQAARAGVDLIVAQGGEAGGHTGTLATLPLVPQIVDAVAPIPVIAAGGIADGRGLAAAIMLGAEGAWLGTAFLAAAECGVSPNRRRRVLEAESADTVYTSVFDIADGRAWPQGVAGRVVRNRFSERWHGHEEELRGQREAAQQQLVAAWQADDPEIAAVWAGEAVGLVHRVEPAGAIVRRIAEEAERTLRERAVAVLGTVTA
ncbi:MAG TPA: nitronate monooxygenase family protein [Dehalococcoidia bacterium]|nr:nitronate monooxygenase family protein [Dehalococcoidia bacterium]